MVMESVRLEGSTRFSPYIINEIAASLGDISSFSNKVAKDAEPFMKPRCNWGSAIRPAKNHNLLAETRLLESKL